MIIMHALVFIIPYVTGICVGWWLWGLPRRTGRHGR